MVARRRKYPLDEFARRGDELFENVVKPQIDIVANHGRLVAVDIETGKFVVGDDELEVTTPLFEQNSEAQPWIVRVGFDAVHRLGAGSLRAQKDD